MTTELDDYVTLAEAAALLRVHKSTVRRWIDQGELPAYRVGHRRLALKRADITRLVRPVVHAGAVSERRIRPVADEDEATDTPEQQAALIAARRAEIPPLTPHEIERGLRAMEEARALRQEILRRRNGELFSPSWEIIHELRDERGRQLS